MNPRRRRIRRIVRATRRIRNRLLHTSESLSQVWDQYTLADGARAGLELRFLGVPRIEELADDAG